MRESTQSGIVRVVKDRTHPYKTLNTTFATDERLGWGARGMLAYLLSKPDTWQVKTKDLVKQSPAGRDAVYSILKDLETHGYLRRVREHGKGGTFVWISSVYEVPQELPDEPVQEELAPQPEDDDQPEEAAQPFTAFPDTVEPDTVEPDTVEPDTVEPDTVEPDTVEPDTVEPDTEKPDIYILRNRTIREEVIKDPAAAAPVQAQPEPEPPPTLPQDAAAAVKIFIKNGVRPGKARELVEKYPACIPHAAWYGKQADADPTVKNKPGYIVRLVQAGEHPPDPEPEYVPPPRAAPRSPPEPPADLGETLGDYFGGKDRMHAAAERYLKRIGR